MSKIEGARLGGRVNAKRQREDAERKYYEEPNYCLNCKKLIETNSAVKVSQTKKKKFCDRSCAAQYNNKGRDQWVNKREQKLRVEQTEGTGQSSYLSSGVCEICEETFDLTPIKRNSDYASHGYYAARFCPSCRYIRKRRSGKDGNLPEERTKQYYYDKYSVSLYARAAITFFARRAYKRAGLPMVCKVCGYNKHAQVCHKKSIADFPMEALIGEINALDNLIALCPNCHWEFDHDFLELS